MHWIFLLLAIGFEVAGTTCMKLSAGFSRTAPAVGMVASYLACFGFLTLAIHKIQVSIAYAIWSGLGTALVSIIGLLWFREALTPLKLFGLLAILAGVVCLNLSGGTHGPGSQVNPDGKDPGSRAQSEIGGVGDGP